jgi:hypothetical protein
MQAINKMLSVIEWVRMFSIGFEIIHKGDKLINVLIDRVGLLNLEQATKQQFMLIPGKA